MAWKARNNSKKIKKRNDYIIEPETDLTKRCMLDVLGTTTTKRSLTTLLMNASQAHLKQRNVEYFIAGNGITLSSTECEKTNNHSEGETAIILGLSTMVLTGKRVLVYGSDVDLFTLLLAHYENIECTELFMKNISGYICISAIRNFLGTSASSALLVLHAITGCDITGKFNGKSKEMWTKQFLQEKNNSKFIGSLLNLLHSDFSENATKEIEGFVCRAYGAQRKSHRESGGKGISCTRNAGLKHRGSHHHQVLSYNT